DAAEAEGLIEAQGGGIVAGDLEEKLARRGHCQICKKRPHERLANTFAAPFGVDSDGDELSLVGGEAQHGKPRDLPLLVAGHVDGCVTRGDVARKVLARPTAM